MLSRTLIILMLASVTLSLAPTSSALYNPCSWYHYEWCVSPTIFPTGCYMILEGVRPDDPSDPEDRLLADTINNYRWQFCFGPSGTDLCAGFVTGPNVRECVDVRNGPFKDPLLTCFAWFGPSVAIHPADAYGNQPLTESGPTSEPNWDFDPMQVDATKAADVDPQGEYYSGCI